MATLTHTHVCATAPRRAFPSLTNLFSLWRSRRALAQLDTRALSDVGLSAQDARKEAARPAWDVPQHWLR